MQTFTFYLADTEVHAHLDSKRQITALFTSDGRRLGSYQGIDKHGNKYGQDLETIYITAQHLVNIATLGLFPQEV